MDTSGSQFQKALMINPDSNNRLSDLMARAQILEDEGKLSEARDVLNQASDADSSSKSWAEARARVALQLKEKHSLAHCRRALAFHAAHPDRQLRMIETVGAELGCDAISLFEDYLREHPDNVLAHERLSELRAESGAGDRFADSYVDALSRTPDSRPLWLSYWNILSRSRRLDETLESMDRERSKFTRDREFLLLEVNVASHAGQVDRAGRALDQLDDRPDARLARGQHKLQTGRINEAAQLLERVAAEQPHNQMAWASLELAWRATGDRRAQWLSGQPGLFSAIDLALTADQLASLAAHLRTLHRSRAQPVGQSVQGGTQTSGQLLMQSDSQILLLIEALRTAIRQFHGKLPPEDPRHPLLRHRHRDLTFGASWSVRLTGGGYHSAHFHPGGILSSACYISLPGGVGDDSQAGWLELGRPPPELNLDLSPLATIKPEPGRLVLFPSYLFHGTRPFSAGERLSVAFDLIVAP